MMMANCVVSFQIQQSARRILLSSRQSTPERSSLWRLFSTVSEGSEKKRVVFLGTPDVAASSLRKLYEASKAEGSTFDIVSVITQPPKRRRRKGKLEPSPVGKVAEELELEILCPEKVSNDFVKRVKLCSSPFTSVPKISWSLLTYKRQKIPIF